MEAKRSSHQGLAYRPDIDGLRGLAVLSVIGFHAGGLLPGGYVGVDIFFVISGFLITSIICGQLSEDRFSFVDFYARRSKRIFPSLIIVLAAVWMFGWMVLLPDEYARLGKHIAAGAGFISNFALWQESGYFDKAAASKPLLHLWSLGIEEQFYLLWPPLLFWAWKRKWNLLNVAAVIVSISFVLNVMSVTLWQATDTFYLPPIRFWELLLGGALAYVSLFEKQNLPSRLMQFRNVQAGVGLLLFLASVIALNGSMRFPGWWALLPTLSAALLISAGPEAWINRRLLANGSLVFVGLISYPLYLWHWPLLSYAYILDSGVPSPVVQAAAVLLAFLFAWITYRLIEKPVRAMRNRAAFVLVPSLIVIACLGLASFSHRFHIRSETFGVEKIVKAAGEWDFPGRLKLGQAPVGPYWQQGNASSRVLFVGDSNMQQYYPRVDKLLADHAGSAKGVVFVTQRSCPPVPNIREFNGPYCRDLIDRAFYAAQHLNIDAVVIGASWSHYHAFTDPDRAEATFQTLQSVVTDFMKVVPRVYLILPMPYGNEFDPYHLVRRSVRGLGFQIVHEGVDRRKITAALLPLTWRLQKIAKATGAMTIDPVDYLCRDGNCATMTDDGFPIYMDDNHLRPAYVREHITFLDPIVLNPETLLSSR